MSAGYTPFSAGNPDQMALMERVVVGKYKIPSSFHSDLKNIIQNTVQVDLTKRLGILKNGVDDLKKHAWFNTINWMALYQQTVEPPYIPKVAGPGDYSQFDKYEDIPQKVSKSDNYEKDFADF